MASGSVVEHSQEGSVTLTLIARRNFGKNSIIERESVHCVVRSVFKQQSVLIKVRVEAKAIAPKQLKASGIRKLLCATYTWGF